MALNSQTVRLHLYECPIFYHPQSTTKATPTPAAAPTPKRKEVEQDIAAPVAAASAKKLKPSEQPKTPVVTNAAAVASKTPTPAVSAQPKTPKSADTPKTSATPNAGSQVG